MKPEIIEALVLELTKATITDPKNAELWVQTYLESEKKIEAAVKGIEPAPKVGARRIKGLV